MLDTVRAELSADRKRINIECKIADRDRIVALPGGKWNKDEGVCQLNLTWASAKQLRGILRERLEIGEGLYKWAEEELNTRINPCMDLRLVTKVSDPGGLVKGLYPFQESGAHFLIAAQHAILADPCGAGKTVQAIAAARALNALPTLVICPNSVKTSWAREVEKWWPGTPTYVIEGSKAKKSQMILDTGDNPGWVIINWESLRLHSRLAGYGSIRLPETEKQIKELNRISWSLVIVDEAHRMKDPTSKQTRAAWKVSEGSPLRWALTGTPLTATPETMWPLLHYLDKEEHPSKTAFINRYCETTPRYWGPGVDVVGLREDTKDEFFEILDPRFRRMPKEVILPDLPPIQYIKRYIDMGPEQTRSYRTMAEDMVSVDENGELIIAPNPIAKLTRTIQYSSANVEVVERITDPETGNLVTKVKLVDPSNKLDALMDDLPDYLESGESVVVFAVHRQLIEMAELRLQEAGIEYSVIKGNQSSTFRQGEIDAFQNGERPVCLVVIAAGGTGINLFKARIGIFLQRPFSNVDHQQAMGRIHRIGSEIHDSILIIDYISPGTSEIGQLQILEGKAENLEAIVRDRESILRLLNGESLGMKATCSSG